MIVEIQIAGLLCDTAHLQLGLVPEGARHADDLPRGNLHPERAADPGVANRVPSVTTSSPPPVKEDGPAGSSDPLSTSTSLESAAVTV